MNFEAIAIAQGWSEATQIAVLLRYIENQQSEAAFNDYLQELCEPEEAGVTG